MRTPLRRIIPVKPSSHQRTIELRPQHTTIFSALDALPPEKMCLPTSLLYPLPSRPPPMPGHPLPRPPLWGPRGHHVQGHGDNRCSLPQVLHTLHLADVAYTADLQRMQLEQEQQPQPGQPLLGRRSGQQAAVAGGAGAAEAEAEAAHEQQQQPSTEAVLGGEGGQQGSLSPEAAALHRARLKTRELQKQKQREQLLQRQRRGGTAAAVRAAVRRPEPLGPSGLRTRSGNPREAVPRFFYHLGG
jgi:hypothetical protein